MTTAGGRLAQLRRWEDSGAHWRVLRRSSSGVELSLLTCDGGEEMDRWLCADVDVLAWVGTRSSDTDSP